LTRPCTSEELAQIYISKEVHVLRRHGFDVSLTSFLVRFAFGCAAVAQDLPDQAEAGEEDVPEPPHPLLDSHAHRQHHQVTAASSVTPRLYDLESADWLMLTHFAAVAVSFLGQHNWCVG
jgi:hypothetical protein